MRRDLFVYLSGPMTAKHGHSVEENVSAGLKVYLDCLQRGIPAFCPHLGGAFPSAWTNVSWEQWLAYDLVVIDRCTHVLMLPRWETSAGALKEKAYAESVGCPVIFSLDELPRAVVAVDPCADSNTGTPDTRDGNNSAEIQSSVKERRA